MLPERKPLKYRRSRRVVPFRGVITGGVANRSDATRFALRSSSPVVLTSNACAPTIAIAAGLAAHSTTRERRIVMIKLGSVSTETQAPKSGLLDQPFGMTI